MEENRLTVRIHSPADAVLYSIQSMDIDSLRVELAEGRYNERTKDGFLLDLEGVFNQFRHLGDTYLNRHGGVCKAYYCRKARGYVFIGNKSGLAIQLGIHIEDGVVKNIFDCSHMQAFNEHVRPERSIRMRDFL